ncbi:hypothetical protein MLD38_028415 [Melastoma candidum]|uniref:Uncharacterized protein n=1 Tax=Melastoma candidum TaxID=119954 RepID=A0ACB9N2A0_9MYRT|nr:hypothetical protein MLD38_028415 [Melastoma candidum]
MNDLFRPYLRRFVLVFFDDILIYSGSLSDHLEHLRTVLNILDRHQFRANQRKCAFGVPEVEYLGHIISERGVAMDPTKVKAVREWPVPHSTKGVRGFLRLAGSYRRFVHNYGSIARPLTELLQKDAPSPFHWTNEANSAFQALKGALTMVITLRN